MSLPHSASALFAVALLPFAIVCCRSAATDAAPTPSVASSARLAPSEDAQLPSSAGVSGSDAAASSVIDASVAIVPKPIEESGAIRCAAARRDFSATVAKSRACTADDDCVSITTSCGLEGVCGVAVTKSAVAKIKAAEARYSSARCTLIEPMPCPTCAMPPPPKCVAGGCK